MKANKRIWVQDSLRACASARKLLWATGKITCITLGRQIEVFYESCQLDWVSDDALDDHVWVGTFHITTGSESAGILAI